MSCYRTAFMHFNSIVEQEGNWVEGRDRVLPIDPDQRELVRRAFYQACGGSGHDGFIPPALEHSTEVDLLINETRLRAGRVGICALFRGIRSTLGYAAALTALEESGLLLQPSGRSYPHRCVRCHSRFVSLLGQSCARCNTSQPNPEDPPTNILPLSNATVAPQLGDPLVELPPTQPNVATPVSAITEAVATSAAPPTTLSAGIVDSARQGGSRGTGDVSYRAHPELFQAAYNKARTVLATDGGDPLPYYREDATEGLLFPGHRGFGVELEYEHGDAANIGYALYVKGLITEPEQNGYHGSESSDYWRFEEDATVSGGEIISPILHDTPQSWDQLEEVCAIIREYGGVISRHCGGHVSVGTEAYDGDIGCYSRLSRLVTLHQDTLFRLATNPKAGRHRGTSWCSPINYRVIYYTYLSDIAGLYGHNHAINMEHTSSQAPYVEFRLFDGTLQPSVIQLHTRLAAGLVEAAMRLRDEDLLALAEDPLASHISRRSTQGVPRRGRLQGDAWSEDTLSFRRFVDLVARTNREREDWTTLYAMTSWQKER